MKTFDEWWAVRLLSKINPLQTVAEVMRQECQAAWNAGQELGEFRITGPGRYLLKIGDDDIADIITLYPGDDWEKCYEENGQNKHYKDHRLIARLPDVPPGGED